MQRLPWAQLSPGHRARALNPGNPQTAYDSWMGKHWSLLSPVSTCFSKQKPWVFKLWTYPLGKTQSHIETNMVEFQNWLASGWTILPSFLGWVCCFPWKPRQPPGPQSKLPQIFHLAQVEIYNWISSAYWCYLPRNWQMISTRDFMELLNKIKEWFTLQAEMKCRVEF